MGYTGYIDSCIWVYRFMYMGMYVYICENTRSKNTVFENARNEREAVYLYIYKSIYVFNSIL